MAGTGAVYRRDGVAPRETRGVRDLRFDFGACRDRLDRAALFLSAALQQSS